MSIRDTINAMAASNFRDSIEDQRKREMRELREQNRELVAKVKHLEDVVHTLRTANARLKRVRK